MILIGLLSSVYPRLREDDVVALTLLFSLFIFLWINAITPGPNNLLLTSSGANFGYMRSLPLFFGMLIGMQFIILLAVLGVGGLILRYNALHLVLKVAGSGYLLWLGLKLITASCLSSSLDTHVTAKPLSLWQACTLQLVNPKAWMMSLGAVAGFIPADKSVGFVLTLMSACVFTVNVLAGLIWLAFGVMIQRLLRCRKHYMLFNSVMGLLALSCISLLWL